MSEPAQRFDLSFFGGASERLYRQRLRFDVELMERVELPLEGVPDAERLAARRGWTEAALQEFAGASTHARTVSAMVQHQLPLDLVSLASQMVTDELAHSELCARVANALGGGTPLAFDAPALLGGAVAPDDDGSLEQLLLRIVRDCCIIETMSHRMLQWFATTVPDGPLRRVWRALARDEALHGKLGFLVLDWAHEALGEKRLRALSPAISRRVAAGPQMAGVIAAHSPDAFTPLGVWGAAGQAACLAYAHRAFRDFVRAPLEARGLLVA